MDKAWLTQLLKSKNRRCGMNKKEFLSAVAQKTEMTLKQTETVLTSIFETIKDVMLQNDRVMVADFGSFSSKERPERKGRNPQTGKEIIIPQATLPNFKAASSLKEAFKNSKEQSKKNKKKEKE